MSKTQVALAIIATIGAFGAGLVKFLQWTVKAWLADRKEDRTARKDERQEDRAALRENTKAMTELSVRVEGLDRRLTSVLDGKEETGGVVPLHNPRKRTV